MYNQDSLQTSQNINAKPRFISRKKQLSNPLRQYSSFLPQMIAKLKFNKILIIAIDF